MNPGAMLILPAIATCLSDAFDGFVIGVFGHEGETGSIAVLRGQT